MDSYTFCNTWLLWAPWSLVHLSATVWWAINKFLTVVCFMKTSVLYKVYPERFLLSMDHQWQIRIWPRIFVWLISLLTCHRRCMTVYMFFFPYRRHFDHHGWLVTGARNPHHSLQLMSLPSEFGWQSLYWHWRQESLDIGTWGHYPYALDCHPCSDMRRIDHL